MSCPRTLAVRWLAGLLLSLGATAMPAPVQAMTVLQVELKTLVEHAAVVLEGTVKQTRVIDRRKEGRGVWTEFTLDVAEVWKGDAALVGKPFAWRHIGGTTADGITVAVPGMPGLRVGEEVVVILEKTTEGHVISGGPQGKFIVRTDAKGQKTVLQEASDVHRMRREPATGRLVEADKIPNVPRPLADMRAEVKAYVAAKPGPAKPVVPPVKPVVPTVKTVVPAVKPTVGK